MNDEDARLREIVGRLSKDPRVRYAEVRFTEETVESVRLRYTKEGGRHDQVTKSRSLGVGIRVLGEKTWGFACTASPDEEAIARTAERAASIAHASSRIALHAAPFPSQAPQRGSYVTPFAVDPFEVAIEERLAELEGPVAAMTGPEIVSADAQMEWRRMRKHLLTTEGTDVEQAFVYGEAAIHCVAAGASGPTQTRSYPSSGGSNSFQGGYERIAELDLTTNAARITKEAIALLAAPPCPAGEIDVILESSQVALQVHESCGHPTELDRALGTEITLAGGSFLAPSMRGSFRYGSDIVTLTCDAITPGGLGTFGWDDEGVAAGKHPLVERGMFVDWLSSRETAASQGRASTGTMRASGWDRVPLIRMTNVSLAPGKGSLEDLIADTKRGLYIETNRSWSIDDQRLDFHFSCELAWEIENGKRTRLVRNPLYGGSTPSFWGACDAICGPEELRLWGIANCGKGDPIQAMGVGHGAPPARFRGVKVGSAS